MMNDQNNQQPYHFETNAVHAALHPDPTTGAIITPIYQTSTFALAQPGEAQPYDYARAGNPTRTALQQALAILEGGNYALSYASGLAAIDTLLRLLHPGDHVIAGDDLYGGTYRLFSQVLAESGLNFTFVDTADPQAVKNALTDATKLIFLETPSNPRLKVSDIARLAQIAHAQGAWLAVDNTFATPALQRPLSLGADFAIHSTTKYIGGHSDTVGGAVVCNDPAAFEQLKFLQKAVGAIAGPMDCFLTLRGLRTLALRMQAHSRNAMRVARFLSDHPDVAHVYYPGLADHPQHALAQKQMLAPGGMISFTLRAGADAARTLVTRTRLFTHAVSLGGVESLIEIPALMTHAAVASSELAVDPGLIRLSVGIENASDLINDLANALAQ